MGAEAAREFIQESTGLPQIAACEDCFLTSSPTANTIPKVACAFLQFSREKFVRECSEELPVDLKGEERFAACRERVEAKWACLLQAKVNLRT